MITIADIEKLSQLARIKISEDEKASLAKEIEAILSYVAEIQKASADTPVNRRLFKKCIQSRHRGT